MSGTPIVGKYSGVATRTCIAGCRAGGTGGRPATSNESTKFEPVNGRKMTPPAVWTPGIDFSRGISWSTNATWRASPLYLESGSDSSNESAASVRKPGSTDASLAKLRISNPAPDRSTTASTNSATTSPSRIRDPDRPVSPPRPASLSVPMSAPRVACAAGNTPNSSPVPTASAIANRITVRSTAIASRRGMPSGFIPIRTSTPQTASSRPRPAPSRLSSRLSVSSCRTSLERPAPSAVRMAISDPRAAARARSRLATFAHAISSTKPTAPSRSSIALRMSPTVASRSGTAVNPRFALSSRYAAASCAPIASISALTLAAATPGLTRPIAVRYQALRSLVVNASLYSIGVHNILPAG